MMRETNISDERGNGEVREMLDRPWRRRVWVAQEAGLGRNLVLVCGPESARWKDIRKVTTGGHFSNFTILGVRYHPMFVDWPDMSYEVISRLRKEKSLGKELRICELLYCFRAFNCTDPGDRI
jgi:hypothetical protein